MTHEAIRLGTRATVTPATLDTARLLALAMERAPDPSIFESVAPFFWDVRASSNRLDYYHTRMRAGRTRTLGNFVRGLKEGVSYQDSHTTHKLGWGQSIDGRLVTTGDEDEEIGERIVEAWGTFFTLPGQTLAGQDTDSFINAVRAGVWRDVSVGFTARDIECGLCGKQSFEWWKEDGCPHLPGLEYELADGDNVTRTAWAWINDGELLEVSQVYEGASPAAAVVKAEQMNAEGRLADHDRARIERRYGTRIARPERRYALGGLPLIEGRGGDMEEQKDQRPSDETVIVPAEEETPAVAEETVIAPNDEDEALEGIAGLAPADDVLSEDRSRLAAHGIRLGTDAVKAVRALGDEVIRLRGNLAESRALADLGRRYKADTIEDTIAAGIRAHGNDFKADQYRRILDQLDIDSIRVMKADFEARGAVLEGGRRTREDAEPEGEPAAVPARGRKRRPTDPEAHKG